MTSRINLKVNSSQDLTDHKVEDTTAMTVASVAATDDLMKDAMTAQVLAAVMTDPVLIVPDHLIVQRIHFHNNYEERTKKKPEAPANSVLRRDLVGKN